MANYKIVFTGPVGAGKTTAINALSDVGTVGTDQRASDMTSHRKDKTTVAMDYGIMKIGDRERVHLYGTPGQERFDFMWDILSEGCIGLVLLLDNTRADPFKDLHFFLKAFPDYADSRRLAIGVTRMDVTRTPDLEAYYESLRPLQLVPPIFEVDARKRQDVATLVRALLYTIDPGLSE